jgi:predicted metalloprotease
LPLSRSAALPSGTPPRLRRLLPALLAIGVVSAFSGWAWARLDPGRVARPLPLSAASAHSVTRRTEVAFADAEGVWARNIASVSAMGYDPARLVFFSAATPSPCSGGVPVSGPFYCPETGTVAFDIMFLDGLGTRLQKGRELGLSIYAARMAAEHLQREMGLLDSAALEMIGARRGQRRAIGTALALQADCLAGVWAAAAAPRIGPVPDDFYRRMVGSSRNLVADLGRAGTAVIPEFDPLGGAPEFDRAEAFARGYAVGALSACVGARRP